MVDSQRDCFEHGLLVVAISVEVFELLVWFHMYLELEVLARVPVEGHV
jgi:hypothetical protein